MTKSNVIFYEQGTLKPKQRATLEDAGYIVMKVDNVEKIKITEPLIDPAMDEDEGFQIRA